MEVKLYISTVIIIIVAMFYIGYNLGKKSK